MSDAPTPRFARPWVALVPREELDASRSFFCQHGFGRFPLRILLGFGRQAVGVVDQLETIGADAVIGFSVAMSPFSLQPSAQFIVIWRDPKHVGGFAFAGSHKEAMSRYARFFPKGLGIRECWLSPDELPAAGDLGDTLALYRRLGCLPPRAG